jgi:hypothetical protein
LGYASGVDIAFAAIAGLGTFATIIGLAGLAILGPRQKEAAVDEQRIASRRRRALVQMAQAHSRAQH